MKTATPATYKLVWRFLRIFLPVFLIAISIGMLMLGGFTFRDEQSILTTRVGNLAARTVSVLGKLPADAGRSTTESVLALLLADDAVDCAVITGRDGDVVAAAPARVGCKGVVTTTQLSLKLHKTAGDVLTIVYNSNELTARSSLFRTFNMLAMVGSFLVAALASVFSFRLIVGKPVQALLAAFTQTQETGNLTKIAHVPDDEMGTVISTFNRMQESLQQESLRIAEAMRRLNHLYNETPALMFSINEKGDIVSASDHWYEATGYARHDLVGTNLHKLLTVEKSDSTVELATVISGEASAMRDIACQLKLRDGSSMDVLLALVADEESSNSSKLCVLSDISRLRAAQNELHQQALTDYLTGLQNRKGLFEHISKIENVAFADRSNIGILFIDLDNFKTVNDTLGHEAGDTLLKAASGRLKNCISKSDVLARLGGDEFAIVLHDLRKPEDACVVANRIITAFANPFRINDTSANVGTSIGVANFGDSENCDDVLRLADLAMYESKQSGRNCVTVYSSHLTAKVVGRDLMVRKIRDGLTVDRFEFHLQPIIDLQNLQPVGAEALLRLNCPNDGLIAPTEIIRVAEETGLINQISAWGVVEGLRIANKNAVHGSFYVAVNLSPKLITTTFVSELVARLYANPVAARNLVLEITETALFENGSDVYELLADLRKTGARIALDDFGTGYSSLGHIHKFPVDLIKLDRSFVKALAKEDAEAQRRRALIKATASLAEELDMKIVAEGIEDEASLELLRSYGISYGQGYFFSPPLPEQACRNWMDAFQLRKEKPKLARVV